MNKNNFISSESLLAKITDLIYHQRNYNIKEILTEITREVQALLAVDRIKVYKFAPDGSGEVIAESLQSQRLPSLLGLHFPDTDIPMSAKKAFIKFNKGVIIDVNAKRKIGIREVFQGVESYPLKTEMIYEIPDTCHLEYLAKMGVMSSLTMPVIYEDKLWGLLVAHHSETRRFEAVDLTLIQLLSKQISIALTQESLKKLAAYEEKQQNTFRQINQIWSNAQKNRQEIWSAILAMIAEALNAEGGLAYLAPELTGKPAQVFSYGSPNYQITKEAHAQWRKLIKQILAKVPRSTPEQQYTYYPQAYTREELKSNFDCQQLLKLFSPKIHSFLFIIMHYQEQYLGSLVLFRHEREWEILWAGRQNYDQRNQRPRQSFAAWCEVKRGSPYWDGYELQLAEALGKHLYTLVSQEQLKNLIHHQINYDNLTQLPNHQIFTKQLNLSLAKAAKNGQVIGVVMLDLNQFKKINESLGHSAGDELVKQVAERIKNYLQTQNKLQSLLARWHGDRFTLLFNELTYVDKLIDICQEILATFISPFRYDHTMIDLTASLGISLAPYDGNEADSIIKKAEIAMYQAKAKGKNSLQLYDPQLQTKEFNWLTLNTDLKRVIYHEQLQVYYQPQVSLKTRKITGVEALVRWNHPRLGWISPAHFIPLAEDIGIIDQLGKWVLKTACEQHRIWEMAGLTNLRLSVNLSPIQLQNPNFLEIVESILLETEMNTEYLDLEITESTLVPNLQETVKILQSLKKRGIKIAIDDFGTGYSSLSTLRTLPIDILKIDQSFIKEILEDIEAAKLYQSIILLGKSLNLRVIAEGVETLEQAILLEELNCDEIQGYLVSHPVEASNIQDLWETKLPNITLMNKDKDNRSLTEHTSVNLAQQAEIKSLVRHKDFSLVDAYSSLKIQLKQQNIRERLLMEIAQKISQSLKLEEVLQTSVTEVRYLLHADRVILFQFDEDWKGQVVVESISEARFSIFGEWIVDDCFKGDYIEYYRQGRVRAIEDITEEGLTPCHVELLQRYQVKSNLVLPIIHEQILWGLLIVHQCQQVRQWNKQEVNLLTQLATQIAIAIHQSELYSKLNQANLRLQKLSAIDGLTQVANRYTFDRYLQEQWHNSRLSQNQLSLILCDIDFFKQYNDTYGHLDGDKCLQGIANAITQGIQRSTDLVARYGGEEFAVILPETNSEEAKAIAHEILVKIRSLSIPHEASEHGIVTVSLGLATVIPQAVFTPEVLIQQADQALYNAKANGRNQIHTF